MASLEQHLANIKIPLAGEKVYKDECVYSCDTPVSITINRFILFHASTLYMIYTAFECVSDIK